MKTVAQARNNYASTKSRMLQRRDALGEAARRGAHTTGDPQKNIPGWFRARGSPLHGFGVFADRAYEQMHPIVMGVGVIVQHARSDPAYSFTMAGAGQEYSQLAFECLDDERTNTIKLFNSSAGHGKGNAEVFWHGAVPVVYATKRINKNAEILLL